MTSWALIIMIAAIAIGLARPRPSLNRYQLGFAIVAVMVIYAGVRQHTL